MSLETGLSLGNGISPGREAPAGSLRALARWWRDSVAEPVISVLFPPRCVVCGDFESHLCPRCEASLVAIGGDCCPRCGEPGPRPLVGRRCSHCMGVELTYAGARSAFVHAAAAKRMVVEFKSGGSRYLPLLWRGWPRRRLGNSWRQRVRVVPWGPARGSRSPGCQHTRRPSASAATTRRSFWPGLWRAPCRHFRRWVGTQAGADTASEGSGRAGRQANLRGAFSLDERALQGAAFSPGSPHPGRRRLHHGSNHPGGVARAVRGRGAPGLRVHLLEGGVGQRRGPRLSER